MLAFVGFGIKAGFIPFHIWLPRAHPAAPSHISALLSGVVIKIGIYGLMRIIVIVKDFPLWCGVCLLIMAAISGVGGVLYALGQHEIKKLLAYHSIENIGIIALGLGIGMIGHAYHQETVAFIGYTAALLHTFNHAVFKGLIVFKCRLCDPFDPHGGHGTHGRTVQIASLDRASFFDRLFVYLRLTAFQWVYQRMAGFPGAFGRGFSS